MSAPAAIAMDRCAGAARATEPERESARFAWRVRRTPEAPEETLVIDATWDGERAEVVGARLGANAPEGGAAERGRDEGPAAALIGRSGGVRVDAERGLIHLDVAPWLVATLDARTRQALYARTNVFGFVGIAGGRYSLVGGAAVDRERVAPLTGLTATGRGGAPPG